MPKAIRILVYEGDKEWLNVTLEGSISAGNPIVFKNKKVSELFRRIYNEGEEPTGITTVLEKIVPNPSRTIITITEKEVF